MVFGCFLSGPPFPSISIILAEHLPPHQLGGALSKPPAYSLSASPLILFPFQNFPGIFVLKILFILEIGR